MIDEKSIFLYFVAVSILKGLDSFFKCSTIELYRV